MVTYAECNTTEVDVSADTETLVLDTTIPSGKGGRIRKIIVVAGATGTTSAAITGFVELKLGSHAGPYRFPVQFAVNADADLGVSPGQPNVIDVDIPVFANETVKAYLTMNGACVDCHVGIIWVSGQ